MKFILGGDTRAESVKNGFRTIASNPTHIMVHDAARPNITESLINKLMTAAIEHDAIIPGIKLTDTIKKVTNNTVTETIDRNQLIAVQTPQVFTYKLMETVYNSPINITEYTDESSIIESLGTPVHVINGDKNNLKLTHPTDLQVLSAVMLPKTNDDASDHN